MKLCWLPQSRGLHPRCVYRAIRKHWSMCSFKAFIPAAKEQGMQEVLYQLRWMEKDVQKPVSKFKSSLSEFCKESGCRKKKYFQKNLDALKISLLLDH